jgi:hypothetical protein
MCVDRITSRSPASSASRCRKRTRSWIQPDRRLVHDQQLRIIEQRLRDAHALAHAARIAAQALVGDVVEADHRQAFVDASRDRARRQPLHRREEREELARRQRLVHPEVLRQVTQLPAQRVRPAGDVLAAPGHPPARGLG